MQSKKPVCALITDCHFGQKNFNKLVFESQLEFFENQFFPFLLKNKIKDVFSLGDLLHNRNTIDLYILENLKQRFFKWFETNKINLHIVIGNHDTYYRSTIETNFYNENLNEFKYSIVYKEDTIINLWKYNIGIIPWVVDTKSWVPPKCDILCGHFDIKDFPMMKNIFSHDGYEVDHFKDYKYVFTGHYHVRSNKNNIHYIGTQYQLNWNDFDEPKGFAVLYEDYEFEYIPNTISPKFVKIYFNSKKESKLSVAGLYPTIQEISVEESISISKENYVRIVVESCDDQVNFDLWYNSLLTVSKNDYKIDIINMEEVIEDYDLTNFEESLENDSDTIDIILNYIEGMTFEKSIEKETLLQLSKQLYQEAYDEALAIGDKD